MDDHRPCRFCRGRSQLFKVDLQDITVDYPMRRVCCMEPECLAQGPLAKNDDEAWAKWNEAWNKA